MILYFILFLLLETFEFFTKLLKLSKYEAGSEHTPIQNYINKQDRSYIFKYTIFPEAS